MGKNRKNRGKNKGGPTRSVPGGDYVDDNPPPSRPPQALPSSLPLTQPSALGTTNEAPITSTTQSTSPGSGLLFTGESLVAGRPLPNARLDAGPQSSTQVQKLDSPASASNHPSNLSKPSAVGPTKTASATSVADASIMAHSEDSGRTLPAGGQQNLPIRPPSNMLSMASPPGFDRPAPSPTELPTIGPTNTAPGTGTAGSSLSRAAHSGAKPENSTQTQNNNTLASGSSRVPPPGADVQKSNKKAPSEQPKLTDADYAVRVQPGVSGVAALICTNFFDITPSTVPETIYRYSVTFPTLNHRPVTNRNVKRELILSLLLQAPFGDAAGGTFPHVATDWNGTIVSSKELFQNELMHFTVSWQDQSQQQPQNVQIEVRPTASLSKQRLLAYTNGLGASDISEHLTVLNTFVQKYVADPKSGKVRVGSSRFFDKLSLDEECRNKWPRGLHPRLGFFASVRPGTRSLLLNMNVSATAFYNRGDLTDLLRSYYGIGERTIMTYDGGSGDLGPAYRYLIGGLQVRYKYDPSGLQQSPPVRLPLLTDPSTGRLKRVNAISRKTVRTQTFLLGTPNQSITVENYFNDHVLPPGTRIQWPHLLAINTGSRDFPVWIPPELLWIEPHQSFRGLLAGQEMSNMVGFARRTPKENADSIVRNQGHGGMSFLKRDQLALRPNPTVPHKGGLGLEIVPRMIQLPARILNPPRLIYTQLANDASLSRGHWNLQGKRFRMPKTLGALHVLTLKGSGNILGFCTGLATAFRSYGIDVDANRQVIIHTISDFKLNSLEAGIQSLRSRGGGPINLILVVFERPHLDDYARIKTWGDTSAGVPTVCCTVGVLRKVLKTPGTGANIALKVNIKLGGVNHTVDSTGVPAAVALTGWSRGTMVVGADVTHNWSPRITLLVVGKRHQTRSYPNQTTRKDQIDYQGNMVPGLVVDAERIRLPYYFDFYLQSHKALVGTARPAHYFVLENGMGLTADKLQFIYLTQDEYVNYSLAGPPKWDHQKLTQTTAKGTSSFGKRHNKTHVLCRRCDNWGEKAKRRKTTGTGRMRSMKLIPRQFKNGFRVGTPKGARGPAQAS
ncbi:hypothetical protein B0A49_07141 [Cryomyces minteri]|uniref:Piwi domain-containing protein n=1 Tax=Cryomyces minteri TaxID=331657 RepID=A0A4V5NG55_9PEZI|nr:hypothetical protein B0A49_07141 [Cryomyces minteri]